MSVETRFRQALQMALKPRRGVETADPLQEVLGAFKTVLGASVAPEAALFKDVAMDSLDLVEITMVIDEKYGERDWQPLFDEAMTRFAINQQPALTPRMMADYLGVQGSHPPVRD